MPYYNRDPKTDHNFDNHPYGDNGKMETAIIGFRVYRGYIGIMEKKMETTEIITGYIYIYS